MLRQRLAKEAGRLGIGDVPDRERGLAGQVLGQGLPDLSEADQGDAGEGYRGLASLRT